ncbi:MAG: globin [Bacteroidales bacterium]|nr:globin [Bacteroidales bacterium]
MELIISYFEPGARPEVTMPDKKLYEVLKEEGVRKLVGDHYACLRKSDISHLFPPDDAAFDLVTKHSADFFIQILGGPSYFNQNRGNPMLIKRHAPFTINPEGRVTWLQCYQEVLSKLQIDPVLILSFWNYINVFSHWMINTDNKTDPNTSGNPSSFKFSR